MEGRIHRSRGILVVPALSVMAVVGAWLLGTRPSAGSFILLVVGSGVVMAWTAVMSLFQSAKHEAEADGLVALVRRAAERVADGAVA